jgi:NAD(P)H dehydrogenase (quinone)
LDHHKEVRVNISVILGHPNKGSFNHAIAETAVTVLRENNHHVTFHDLYAENFDPLLPAREFPKNAVPDPAIQQHCAEIAVADGIIIIHPNWWGQPPAVLKGWIDRILRPGVAYEFFECDKGEGVPRGLLQATAALVFNTSDTPAEREKAVFGDPLELIWKNCIFGLCGIQTFYRATFGVMVTSTQSMRETWLQEVRKTVSLYFPDQRRRKYEL